MSKETKSFSGTVWLGMLFLVFLVLKLAEIGAIAKWSWWWVTAPLWIPLCVGAIIIACLFLYAYLAD